MILDPTNFAAPLLAQSDDTSTMKMIFFAIGLVIWIISALAKSVGKQSNQTQQPDPLIPDIEPELPPPPQPAGQWGQTPIYNEPAAPVTRPPPMPSRAVAPAFRGKQPAAVSFPAEWLGKTATPAPPPLPMAAPVYTPVYVPGEATPVPVELAKGKVVTGYETSRAIVSAPAQVKQRAGKAASTTRPLDAAAIRKWMTPTVMSRQFILTELFDPPPSARKE